MPLLSVESVPVCLSIYVILVRFVSVISPDDPSAESGRAGITEFVRCYVTRCDRSCADI